MSSYPTKMLSMARSMISGMIELITTGLSLDLREIRIETFLCSADAEGITASRGSRNPFIPELRFSDEDAIVLMSPR